MDSAETFCSLRFSTPTTIYFLKTVKELEGCPVRLITDLGTENGLAASMQCYFQDNLDAHCHVSSP